MKNFLTPLLFLISIGLAGANSPFLLRETFQWQVPLRSFELDNQTYNGLSFRGAVMDESLPGLPLWVQEIPLDGPGELRVRVLNLQTEPLTWVPLPATADYLTEDLRFQTAIEKDRGRYWGKIVVAPVLRRGNSYERLVSLEIQVDWVATATGSLRSDEYTTESRLRNGDIYQFAVEKTGMYRLNADFLRDQLKIDLAQVDPRQIKILGTGGGMLATSVAGPRIDDLREIPISIVGESDGRFDAADYILFYGEGPDRWIPDPNQQVFNFEKNLYDTQNFYYLQVSSGSGQRLANQPEVSNSTRTTESFDDFDVKEDDKVNLLADWVSAEGSGAKWYGDHFRNVREYTYNRLFTFPNLIPEEPVRVRAEMVVRALQSSRFTLILNGTALTSNAANAVARLTGDLANIEDYVKLATLQASTRLNADVVDAIVRYPNPGGPSDGSQGWLDFIQLNVRRRLIYAGTPLALRDWQSVNAPATTYVLRSAPQEVVLWDITDPLAPRVQSNTRQGTDLRWSASGAGQLRTFIAFQPGQGMLTPKAVGKIGNQNLHQLTQADLLIIYPQQFAAAAAELAQHRESYSELTVALAPLEQVFHEFSGGRHDPTAIRDLARMLYLRDPNFRYLLLLGDGSFDHRNILGVGNNFIPTFQREAYNPLYAFPADDYFALLENDNPADPLAGRLQIAVGRLPVKSEAEALAAVEKIKRYDLAPETYTDWRNRIAFVGDDEDGNLHVNDANLIADDIRQQYPALNIDKIFLDAYPQESTSGGNRFPAVTEAINQSVFKGALALTYLGHGSPRGWAQERVLTIPDIVNWQNRYRMPLLVTATCSFTAYDDPEFVSAGEEAFLNPNGGAIGLLTTVRAVFANQNAELTDRTLATLFSRPDGAILTIGEAMQRAKNSFTGSFITLNSRKFTLIGDPSQRLAIPDLQVRTTAINGKVVTETSTDTLRALQQVRIEGEVVDFAGNRLENFNGILYPSIFDKVFLAKTLAQDRGSFPLDFQVQKNIIFNGRASVQNGRFAFTFVIPKDINYAFGAGKFSFYAAEDLGTRDASGSFQNISIGGNSTNQVGDDQGPQVDVFLNSTDFIFGNITGPEPVLYVQLTDDNGINVVGNSIGHDLEATLDENTQQIIVLNDFFSAALDDYTRGEVRYPLSKLSEGRHSIRVKAWDVANNPAEGYTEFVVSSSAEIALEHVLNYPNPFTDRTCFQFDHNLPNQTLDVLIQIYTISGQLVKTIDQTIFSDGYLRRDDCIAWDGRDDFGDRLARGVYLYRVSVRANIPGSTELRGESKFEKLVLLK